MKLDLERLEDGELVSDAVGSEAPPVYVVSGSTGTLGEQMARTVLPQFQDAIVPIEIVPRVQHFSQIEAIVDQAAQTNGTILHTLTNQDLRYAMIRLAEEKNVAAIDVVGPYIERLTEVLGIEPIGQPGLYRQLNETYFKRIEAIEFTLAHDDGMHYEEWKNAEIVLVGLSRVGKTPLSVYLSIQGWKVANVPLVPGVPPRQELFELDWRRVIGLKIDPIELRTHREHRQRVLGVRGKSDYDNPAKLYDETKAARKIFRKGGFKVIDVTNKPIETTAGQVVVAVTRHFK